MSQTIPTQIRRKMEKASFKLLDDWMYLNRTRRENSQFMDNLVEHPKVGKKLSEFMGQENVRTYIKDVIVKTYQDEKRKMPRNLNECCFDVRGEAEELRTILNEGGLYEMEIDWRPLEKLSLHRTSRGVYLLIARTTFAKWETGLRKILLYIADRPELQKPDCAVIKCLAIYDPAGPVNESDKKQLEGALTLIKVACMWNEP